MIALQIISKDMPLTDAIKAHIREHVDKLEALSDRVHRCEVALSSPHRHRRKGKIFHIHVRLHLPGQDVVVNREPERNGAHENFQVALHDAFAAVERKLEEHVQKMRATGKHHRDRIGQFVASP